MTQMDEVSIEVSSGAARLHVAAEPRTSSGPPASWWRGTPAGIAGSALKPSENSLLASNEALRAELPGMRDQTVSAIESAFL